MTAFQFDSEIGEHDLVFRDEKERADSALMSMEPPRDYATWKDLSISYKAAGGDLDTFLSWCMRDPEKYDEKVARKLFENVDSQGAITAGTLYYHARQGGWSGRLAGGEASGTPVSPDTVSPDTVSPSSLHPVEQAILQIETLFLPGEQVNVTWRSSWNEKKQKWQPSSAGACFERGDLVSRLRQARSWNDVFDGFNPEAGIWLCQNPTDGTGRGNKKTTAFRHALIESDTLPEADQLRIIKELQLPVSTITRSGGKSVHALVRIDADGSTHYAERVALLHDVCNRAGLDVDAANKDSCRLTRLAGALRGEDRQQLLLADEHPPSFDAWRRSFQHSAENQDENQDEQNPLQKFYELFSPMPEELQELAPVFIENTLRKGQIMMVGAAPKTGKSFLAAQMAVAFAAGLRVLDYEFTKCERVLLVNTEMPRKEYENRLVEAAIKAGQDPREIAGRVRVAHTDDRPGFTVEDISEIIVNAWTSGFAPDVLIIDPIYPVFIGDENSNEQAKVTLGYLKEVASVTCAAVIYTHHFSKGSQDSKAARDRVSGAGTLGRNYAAMWSFTELAPSEEEMSGLPDGSAVFRVDVELRSFKQSKENRNVGFNAVRIDGIFHRDIAGLFDSAPTREAERSIAAKRRQGEADMEKKVSRAREIIKTMLEENGGEPVLFESAQGRVKVSSPNTLKGYLYEMDEYQIVKLKVDGKGQSRKHIAWASWQAPLDAELVDESDSEE